MPHRNARRIGLALLLVGAVTFTLQVHPALAASRGSGKTKSVSSTTTTVPLPSTTTTVPPPSPLSTYTFPITKSGTTLLSKYCGTGRVDQPNAGVRRLVVVVHGDSRNACDHASYVQQAATAAGVAGSTLTVAPAFLTDADVTASDASLIYWSNGGWKSGSQSLTSPFARPWTISSFAVTDLLIQRAIDRALFPNLTSVVVVGHSAGGQFTNRYAATSRVGSDIALGPSYRFVVANPSSYLYLDGRRYTANVLAPLTAGEVSACPGYNDYKYGLARPYSYVRDNDVTLVSARYRARSAVYLLGDADTDPNHSSLDTTCEGKWQGRQRLERGQLFYRSLGEVYGTGVYSTHQQSIVPGVGHEALKMYTSAQGVAALFP